MFLIQNKLPREVYVACSGGVDSMAVVDFLSSNHKVNILFFDHGTESSRKAKNFLGDYISPYSEKGKSFKVETVKRLKSTSESWEEYWRNERYEWFHSFSVPIITCHHLDDCVETWIWSSFHGQGKIIPYKNQNVIRPFRLNKKTEFVNWCRNKKVPWIEDSSNQDVKYMRNYIRHEIVPKALVVNPGLATVIRKKVVNDFDNLKYHT